jgi:DNA-binding NarL/FixJ family response regulator
MHDEPQRADVMRQAGAVEYLSKSGPADELIAAIRAAAAQAAGAAAKPTQSPPPNEGPTEPRRRSRKRQ